MQETTIVYGKIPWFRVGIFPSTTPLESFCVRVVLWLQSRLQGGV